MIKQRSKGSRWQLLAIGTITVYLLASPIVQAAIVWDGEAGTQWWFKPVNLNNMSNVNNNLAPNDGGATPAPTDAQINLATTGEGVVYDPTNDPFFSAASSLTYPTGSGLASIIGRDYGPQTLYRLYTARNSTNTSLLTIKSGDLAIESTTIIGRSGSSAAAQNLGRVNQLGGKVQFPLIALDMGNSEASGWGHGTWDYRGGILEVSQSGGNGLRLSSGSSSGPGGVGRFIMHNPATAGYVRAFDFNVAANA